MHARTTSATRWEFYLPDLDNHLLVEVSDNDVLIRSSRDNVSNGRRSAFIRHLAVEGCIPDRYQQVSESGSDRLHGLRWVRDQSIVTLDPNHLRRATGLVIRLIFYASLLLLVMMAIVVLKSPTH